MTLRDQIAEIVGTIEYAEIHPDKGADAILALVREALTSEAAVEAAATGYFDYKGSHGLVATHRDNIEDAITAAFDAVTKEG